MAVVVRCEAKSAMDAAIRKYFTYSLAFNAFKPRETITSFLRKDESTISLPLGSGTIIAEKYKIRHTNKGDCSIEVKASISFRPYQIPIVKELDEKWHDEAKGSTSNPGILAHLSPAWGKTILGAYAIGKTRLRTLVVVPLTTLKTSWEKVLKEHTDAKYVVINSKEQLLSIDASNPPDVIICMVTYISKIPEELKRRIGLMILDEGDRCCTMARIREILSLEVKRVLVLTGTPDHPSGKTKFLDYLAPIRVVSPPPKYTVLGLRTGMSYTVKKKEVWNRNKGTYSEVRDFNAYLHDIADDKKRLSLIREIVQVIGEKVMILVRYKKHVEAIAKTLLEAGITTDYLMGSKTTYKDSTVLIGTCAKMGVGMDEANTCEDFSGVTTRILILADTVKMTSDLFQYIGRVLRSDDPYIIQLIDDHSLCIDHWKENSKFYSQQGQIVQEISYEEFLAGIDSETVPDTNGTTGMEELSSPVQSS